MYFSTNIAVYEGKNMFAPSAVSFALQRAWEGATNRMLKNHLNYLVFNGCNFHFNLLIEISSNYFKTLLCISQKGSQFLDFILKYTENKVTNPLHVLENQFFWDKISLVLTIF